MLQGRPDFFPFALKRQATYISCTILSFIIYLAMIPLLPFTPPFPHPLPPPLLTPRLSSPSHPGLTTPPPHYPPYPCSLDTDSSSAALYRLLRSSAMLLPPPRLSLPFPFHLHRNLFLPHQPTPYPPLCNNSTHPTPPTRPLRRARTLITPTRNNRSRARGFALGRYRPSRLCTTHVSLVILTPSPFTLFTREGEKIIRYVPLR